MNVTSILAGEDSTTAYCTYTDKFYSLGSVIKCSRYEEDEKK